MLGTGKGWYTKADKHPDGKFWIVIVTSGRGLRWPYSRDSEEPKYKTKKEAESILKAYIKFTDTNKYKRYIEEFEIVDITK